MGTRPWRGSAQVSQRSQRSALVVKIISDIASWRGQQPSLSSTGWGIVIPVGGAIASPQADATWRGVLCLRTMASEVWGMTQYRDPGGGSFRSLPRATNPRLPPSVSTPLCPPSARAQCKWLQMKFLCWTFNRLSESPAVSFWQTETLQFFTAGCYLGSFLALVL